jgi:hypothetical protein
VNTYTYTFTVGRRYCLPLGYHSAPPCARKAMREASWVDVMTYTDKDVALRHAEALHVATGLFHDVAVYRDGRLFGGARVDLSNKDRSNAHRARRMAGGEG